MDRTVCSHHEVFSMLHAYMGDRHNNKIKTHNCPKVQYKHFSRLERNRIAMQNGLEARDGTVMPEIGGRWGLIAWDHQDNGD